MVAALPRWSDRALRAALVAVAAALVGVPAGLYLDARGAPARGGAPAAQPLDFDHARHAGVARIDCRFCHPGADRGAAAGLPALWVCLGCHDQDAAGEALAPLRRAARTGAPIRWARVHDLPDFARFDHAAHAAAGIGCEPCHGQVERAPRVRRTAPLTMAWCVACHRDPSAWLPPGAAAARRPVTHCSACHR